MDFLRIILSFKFWLSVGLLVYYLNILLLDLNFPHSMWTVALLLLIGVSGCLGRVYTASEINWPTDSVSSDEQSELLCFK